MTHGTLTNNQTGFTLGGELNLHPGSAFYTFCIDGTTFDNSFKREEWTFEADKPTYPVGTIVQPGNWKLGDNDWALYVQTGEGWRHLNLLTGGVTKYPQTESEVRSFESKLAAKDPVFRVIHTAQVRPLSQRAS